MSRIDSWIATVTGLTLVFLFSAGCFTAELNLELGGVFACESDDDDACPTDLFCVNQRCEHEDGLPILTVLGPEDEEVLETQALDLPIGPSASPFPLTIRIQGTLDLVAANSGADHDFGEGHVAVFVDGEEQLIVDNGSISATSAVEVEVNNVPGPHRISLQARRNDGTDYDNPEATANRLFWLESQASRGQRPFVAIKSPWPGTDFALDDTDIEVTVATHNVDFEAPSVGVEEGKGHTHIYYDVELPDCVRDDGCDGSYLGVASSTAAITITAPSSQARNTTLTAVLRHIGHAPYGFPFECNPRVDLAACQPVFDEIAIGRVDD